MLEERIVHFQFPSNSTSFLNHNSKDFLQNISGLFSITIIRLQHSYNFSKIMRFSFMANIKCTST